MRVDILTLFPRLFDGFKEETLIKRALLNGCLDLHIWNLRSWARSKHQQVDDTPFGGGPGMILKPEPIFEALDDLLQDRNSKPLVVYFSPSGKLLRQSTLNELCEAENLIFICGRYKGVDQRVLDNLVDCEISIGDFVLSGGELPAMVTLEGITRLIPGVINDIESATSDSHYKGLLEGPLYTRPEEYRSLNVPDILLSGDHAKIADWRREKSFEITRTRRPDLWKQFIKNVPAEEK